MYKHTKNKLPNPRYLSENLTCAPHQSDSDRCESKYDLENAILTTKNIASKTIETMFRKYTPQPPAIRPTRRAQHATRRYPNASDWRRHAPPATRPNVLAYLEAEGWDSGPKSD